VAYSIENVKKEKVANLVKFCQNIPFYPNLFLSETQHWIQERNITSNTYTVIVLKTKIKNGRLFYIL